MPQPWSPGNHGRVPASSCAQSPPAARAEAGSLIPALATKTQHKSCVVFGVLMKNASIPKSNNAACAVLRKTIKEKSTGNPNSIKR